MARLHLAPSALPCSHVITLARVLLTHRQEFRTCAPLLVVAPQSVLEFWEGEWEFWAQSFRSGASEPSSGSGAGGAAGPSSSNSSSDKVPLNVVVYSGSTAARACILEHEVWLNPTSGDGKASRVSGSQASEGGLTLAGREDAGLGSVPACLS